MSVVMRILQTFDARHEREFMELERRFAALEVRRPDYPRGRRLQPIAAAAPCNTLVWEAEFPDLDAARAVLAFFQGDAEHEALFRQQSPLFRDVRVEFYELLPF